MRRIVMSILVMVLATPAFAGEISFLGGYGATDNPTQKAGAYQLEYLEGLGENFAWSVSYLNQGHFIEHHRDGNAATLWLRTNRLDRQLSLALGVGGVFYYDTIIPPAPAPATDFHGWGTMVNVAASWYTESRAIFQVRGSWLRGGSSFDTLSVLAGIGAVVGGHSHSRVEKPIPVNGAYIVQAWEHGKALGILDLSVVAIAVSPDYATDNSLFALTMDGKIYGSTDKGVNFTLLKTVAGAVNQRPPWFFDIRQQGEGLTDVGTHLVDLVQWTLFPEAALDYKKDIRITGAKRWATVIPLDGFQRVTGEAAFPGYLASAVKDGKLNYFCNNTVEYTLRGIPVKLDVKWDFELPPGGNDTTPRIIFWQLPSSGPMSFFQSLPGSCKPLTSCAFT